MFTIRGLEPALFDGFFELPDDTLVRRGARRVRADRGDAYPCRIALKRVDEGEELLLLNFEHQPVATSPYRASGPIFVSRSSQAVYDNELPPLMRDRLMALKAYDSDAFIVDAEVGEGTAVEVLIRRFLRNPAVAFVDAHFARRGCFAARIERGESLVR
jgi:hypothetical protein